eukprot:TRINITY_DN3150_c0_g1_i1.p1 TRINITY_DN3150_c0_g1~~TRINITY_DN3150_c0_g1_i1.p1  ORF type:complete len:323 (-),score=33.06 TRINITY_DN3150_c0_g1_i1:4-972(-)
MWNKKVKELNISTIGLDYFIGGVSAGVARTAIAPIERIKLILQTQPSNLHINSEERYKGIKDTFTRVTKAQGVRSLWRGNMVNLVKFFPAQAMNFMFRDIFKEFFLKGVNPKTHNSLFALGNIVSGSLAGAASLCTVYPLDLIRTRLATDVKPSLNKQDRQFRGVSHCIVSTLKTDGIKGLYRGMSVSLYGIVVYRGLSFGLYDTFKGWVPKDYIGFKRVFFTWLVAQNTQIIAHYLSYPFDTVRRNMMMSHRVDGVLAYKNSWECWSKLSKNEGVTSFFAGSLTNVYRSMAGAVVLVMYDEIQQIFYTPKTNMKTEDLEYI